MALTRASASSGLREVALALLRTYAQVLFSRSPVVGALLLAATLTHPVVAAHGLLAAALALVVARALGLPPEPVTEGTYGYNALLVGLGVGAVLQPGGAAASLFVAGVVLAVLLTAALRGAITVPFDLPVLTLPFVLAFPLVLGAAARLAAPRVLPGGAPPPGIAAEALTSLGALFFVASPGAGALVLLALLVHSRIGVLLVAQGLALAWAIARLGPPAATPALQGALGYNLALIALGVGGLWFVPGPSSFLLAGVAAASTGLVAVGALPVLDWLGLPLLVIPFNVVAAIVLLATRQRLRDVSPRSAPLVSATPEANLHTHRTRVARLGASYAVRLRAPFLGRWTCTQGVDGPHTHRGAWAQAADFEVVGPDGRAYRGAGARREDHLCYHLPIVAPAAGVVAAVVDGVPDNAIGDMNLRENWGNLVVLQHGPGLYSLLAHLSPRTIKVREGQRVRRGELLGLCGSSGRSPVPHLHVQLQASPVPGAPTLPFELHDVVVADAEREALRGVHVPEEGQVLRNLEPGPELEERLRFEPGARLAFEVVAEDGVSVEVITSELDLFGARRLRSTSWRCALEYEVGDGLFTVLDTSGPRRSVLHLLHAALGRVPLEATPGLSWTDRLPHGSLRSAPALWLLDALTPFLPDDRPVMRHTLAISDGDLIVSGESERRGADGLPHVRTRCVLRNGQGPAEVQVVIGGRERRARRVPLEPDPSAAPAATAAAAPT